MGTETEVAMFNDNIFEQWLDNQANLLITKIGDGVGLSSEEMMILVLKAQSNHFHHLDQELREEIQLVREEIHEESKRSREEIHEESKRSREDFRQEIQLVREDMDRRFEQVDKRFEQVDKRFEQIDKRFEQVDKRFDALIARMDRFMLWSLGLTVSSTFLILGFMFTQYK
ncbi:MAG: hypothetical protein HQM11_20645 [SAR324 cluster bacterium]|nr:hypothetical protein [SAR324 cluster bacterium]